MDDQAYYWTAGWQVPQREALEALKRGEGVTFRDAAAAIRWLKRS